MINWLIRTSFSISPVIILLVVLVLGSKFYISGGLDPKADWSKETLILDLEACPPSSSPPIMSKDSLSKGRGPDMSNPKFYPCATLIALEHSTKICVFSPNLFENYGPNFELFDPEDMSWSKVPDPFEHLRVDDLPFYVEACHTEKSCLCISTTHGSYYTIDFADQKPQWKLSDMPPFLDSSRVKVDRHVFAPLGLNFETEKLPPYECSIYRYGAWIALLGRKLCLCALEYIPAINISPLLSVDILDCDSYTLDNFLSDCPHERNFPTPTSFFVALNCSFSRYPCVVCGGYQ